MRLRPVTFRYTRPFSDGSKPIQYGLIAEEVAEVYPDLVARSADGQIETVKYQVLDAMLLNEVQRQQGAALIQQQPELQQRMTYRRRPAAEPRFCSSGLRRWRPRSAGRRIRGITRFSRHPRHGSVDAMRIHVSRFCCLVTLVVAGALRGSHAQQRASHARRSSHRCPE